MLGSILDTLAGNGVGWGLAAITGTVDGELLAHAVSIVAISIAGSLDGLHGFLELIDFLLLILRMGSRKCEDALQICQRGIDLPLSVFAANRG